MFQHLKAWWPAHAAWVTGLAYAAWPGVRRAMCDNPTVSGTGIAAALFLAFLKSNPWQKKP